MLGLINCLGKHIRQGWWHFSGGGSLAMMVLQEINHTMVLTS